MKAKQKDLLDELHQALQQVGNMQLSGQLNLPAAVAFAMGKNFGKTTSIDKAFHHNRDKLLKKYVEVDADGNLKTKTVGDATHYDFKEGGEMLYKKGIQDFLDLEIDFVAHKVSASVLEQVDNFPATIYAIIEQYGMITELSLLKAMPN